MSRSGYGEYGDADEWAAIRWAGAVKKALRGKRGQAFLREMLAAMDALPEKRLIKGALSEDSGAVCAIGSVGAKRGVDMSPLDPQDYDKVAAVFDIAPALVREITFVNDDDFGYEEGQSDEDRFNRVRQWVIRKIEE